MPTIETNFRVIGAAVSKNAKKLFPGAAVTMEFPRSSFFFITIDLPQEYLESKIRLFIQKEGVYTEISLAEPLPNTMPSVDRNKFRQLIIELTDGLPSADNNEPKKSIFDQL